MRGLGKIVLLRMAPWLILFIGACLPAPFLYAQSFTATIVGRVMDEKGVPLTGATVQATNRGTGHARAVSSDESGQYFFLLLPAGEYTLAAELAGFRRAVRPGVVLQIDQRVNLDLQLRVGSPGPEVVEVEAGTPRLQTEMAAAGNVIDRKKILDLPLNGREFQQLALLVPGTYPPAQGSSLSFRGGFNCAGARETANYFLIDGIDNNNSAANQYTFRPSIDAIQEFKVQLSTYSAEFGRGAGGQINIVTRSGSNAFHGVFYEFHRNSALDAKNFFDPPGKIPPFKRNQFGATLGGPVSIPRLYRGHDRSFFFLSYEGLRLRQAVTRTASVPTAALSNGDFSSLLTGPNPIVIRDPLTRQPFANNVIPAARLDGIGRAIAQAYPAPNRLSDPVRNFVSTPSQPQDVDQLSVRIDQHLTPRASLAFRYSINQDDQTEVFDPLVGTLATNLPGFGRIDGQRTQSLFLTYTHILSPRLINEFRLGYNRLRQSRFPEQGGQDWVGRLGIPGLSRNARDAGFPATRVTGFDSLGDSTQLPQGRADNTFHFIDNVSIQRGSHTLKAGLDLRPFQSNNFNPIFARGDFRFTGLYTGTGLADLLLGLAAQTTRGVGDAERGRRQKSHGFYVQDDWKVNRRLTLNLGLRYELNLPLYEVFNRMSAFDPALRRILVAGRDGVRRSIFDPDHNNWAPRVGFAWQPRSDSRWVVRGGYGVYYDLVIVGNELGALFFNAPFRSTEIFNGSLATPIVLTNPFPAELVGAATLSPNGVQRDLRNSYLQQFSLGVQREVGCDWVAEVSYVGSKGSKLMRTRNINQATLGPGSIASRRPFAGFGNINFRESSASSTYHSLQMRLDKRFARGLSVLTAYTFSRAIDDASAVIGGVGSNGSPQNSHDLRGERGLSDFDARHRLVLSYIYELPLGAGKKRLSHMSGIAHQMVSGWQFSGIASFQSGRPFTPRLSRDISNTGQLQDRPHLISNPRLAHPDPARWFNVDAFRLPAPSTFGNAGRDILIGSGINNFDAALFKNHRLGEQGNIQFRVEFFNFFNRPHFNLPNLLADSSQFGAIFSAGSARQIQFGLKLYY